MAGAHAQLGRAPVGPWVGVGVGHRQTGSWQTAPSKGQMVEGPSCSPSPQASCARECE